MCRKLFLGSDLLSLHHHRFSGLFVHQNAFYCVFFFRNQIAVVYLVHNGGFLVGFPDFVLCLPVLRMGLYMGLYLREVDGLSFIMNVCVRCDVHIVLIEILEHYR